MTYLQVCIFVSLLLSFGHSQTNLNSETLSAELRDLLTQEGLYQHLQAFQDIADVNGGNRSAGSSGYDASVAYVQEKLEAAGYAVTLQAFEVPSFEVLTAAKLEQTSPQPRSFVSGADIMTMNFSSSGNVTANMQAVDVQLPPGPSNSSTSGCEASDFNDFAPGNIALLQRGTCTFQTKVERATAAGASAVIIFNEGQAGRTQAFAGGLRAASSIPVVSASFEVGQMLVEAEPELHLVTDTLAQVRVTHNLIAESKSDGEGVVMIGGHLDSVPNGPGIHDNGSGSAAILEIALQLAELYDLNGDGSTFEHKVRFAWWGGEEVGLLGSRHYVDSLSRREKRQIKGYLNLDMIGSPNFVRFVYDGDESDRGTNLPLPEGTAEIERVFLDYFAEEALPTTPVAVFSRSDHDPFARAGIPVGGLFTGAEGTKSNQAAERYGGKAGEAFDVCYHRACDTVDNVDLGVLEQMADAAAHALITLASDSVKQ